MRDDLLELAAHMEWADALVWGTTLNHADDTPAEVLAQRVADLCLHGILQPAAESA